MRIKIIHIVFLFLLSFFQGFSQIPWEVEGNGLVNEVMMVFLNPDALELDGDLSFEEGDALGAFINDSDVLYCVGYVEWDTSNALKTLLIHMGTSSQYGFTIGDTVMLRQWDNSSACIRDIYQLSAVSSDLTDYHDIVFYPDSTLFLESMTASDISFTYDTTLFCWDDTTSYAATITNSFNHTDHSLGYDYTSTSSESLDLLTGEIIPYLALEAGQFQVNLSTDYCLVSSSFDYEVQDCMEELALADTNTSTPYFQPSSINNSLFPIDGNAKAEILDVRGRLVNELQAPIHWDGSDRNGNMLPTGLYFILLDGKKKYELTLVR